MMGFFILILKLCTNANGKFIRDIEWDIQIRMLFFDFST